MEVRVFASETEIFTELCNGQILVPTRAEWIAARQALVDAIAVLDSPAMIELATDIDCPSRKPVRPRIQLRLVK